MNLQKTAAKKKHFVFLRLNPLVDILQRIYGSKQHHKCVGCVF